MNTNVMSYIITVAEERSVTRAAERLYLSTAVLHRHIRNVEEDLGTPIFTHGRDGMQLTPAGVIFVNNAQAILHLELEMQKKINALCQGGKNVVRVAVDSGHYNSTVRNVLPAFQRAFPECRLELFKCNIVQTRSLLAAEDADLGIVISPTPFVSGFESIPVRITHVRAVFPPNYQGPTDMAHLAQAESFGLIPMLHPIGTSVRMMEEQRLIDLQINPSAILEGNYRDAVPDVLNGIAYTFLPEELCDVYRPQGIIVGEVFMQFYDLMIYSASHVLPSESKSLMNMMLECYSDGSMFAPYRAGKEHHGTHTQTSSRKT